MRPQIIYKPMGDWPGKLRSGYDRRSSPFTAEWPQTEQLLIDEASALNRAWTDVVVTIQVATDMIRRDGAGLLAKADLAHPGVIVNFGSKLGEIQVWSDRFERWRDNVRGIALALEAMRKIDRYGVGRGDEQYQGWLALDAGSGVGASVSDEEFLASLIGCPLAVVQRDRLWAVRSASMAAHPDKIGGSHDAMVRVNAIRERWSA